MSTAMYDIGRAMCISQSCFWACQLDKFEVSTVAVVLAIKTDFTDNGPRRLVR